MRGNFFTVDELVCSYFNRQEYSIFYSAAFVHTFDRALILFIACEFKRRENKQKTVAGLFVLNCRFCYENCPPLLVAAGHGFLANTVSKNLFQ